MRDFSQPNIPSFSTTRIVRTNFDKLILRTLWKYHTRNRFCYLIVFLLFWKLVLSEFTNWYFNISWCCSVVNWTLLVSILFDLKWLCYSAVVLFVLSLRYPVSSFKLTLWLGTTLHCSNYCSSNKQVLIGFFANKLIKHARKPLKKRLARYIFFQAENLRVIKNLGRDFAYSGYLLRD